MLAVCVSLTAASSLSLMLLIFLHSGGLKCFRAASSTCFRLSCQYRLRVSCFMYVLPYIKCKFWGIFAWLCLLHDLGSFYTAEKHRWVSVWNPSDLFLQMLLMNVYKDPERDANKSQLLYEHQGRACKIDAEWKLDLSLLLCWCVSSAIRWASFLL